MIATETLTPAIREALVAARRFDPEITTVLFLRNGTWLYLTDDGETPEFNGAIDEDLLDAAANEAWLSDDLPCVYHLLDEESQ